MKKTIAVISVLLCLNWIPVQAEDAIPAVSSSDLINEAEKYDGSTVIFQGEAIGEELKRGDYAWINLSDGSNAIGIYMTQSQALEVKNYGSYSEHGDTVQIIGVFHRACSDHGGDLDIHAQSISIIKSGYEIHPQISGRLIAAALTAAGIAAIMCFFAWKQVKYYSRRKL